MRFFRAEVGAFGKVAFALFAAIPNALYLEYIPWFEVLYHERIALDADGKAVVPTAPGWGYRLDPDSVEFWQGRAFRLHDRLRYAKQARGWKLERLSP